MKKVVFLLLISYILFSVTLFITHKQEATSVSILSLKEQHSRVITSQEELFDVFIYFDQTNSFFTDIQNVENCELVDEFELITVKLFSIVDTNEIVTYENKNYTTYQFNLSFEQLYSENASFEFENASLNIYYSNDVLVTLEIGNVNLLFDEVSNFMHLDIQRLYGVFNEIEQVEYLMGIVLNLEAISPGIIEIKKIECNVISIHLDLEHIVFLDQTIDAFSKIDEIILLSDYSNITEEFISQSSSIVLNSSKLIFIPLLYKSTLLHISRFPLIITYMYLGNEYVYVMDDFLFYHKNSFSEVSPSDIKRIEYHY
ncbi:MAG: hypothetical protein KJ971_00225 [Firmicutes bacterium]|nr:hypothetical protein [Bacillota bacterium]